MNDHLLKISWPISKLGEALEALARRSGLLTDPIRSPPYVQDFEIDGETHGRWIRAAAGQIGLEAEAVSCSYAELEQLIFAAGPALLRLRVNEEPRFLALIGRGWRTVSILDPHLKEQKVKPSLICSALRQALEAPLLPDLDRLLENVGVPRRNRVRARVAILRERLSAVTLSGFWLVRLSPGSNFGRQLRHARAGRLVAALAAAHTLQYVLWLTAWLVVGRGALQGRLDYFWLIAWALLLLTIIPLRLSTTWMQGVLAIRTGGLLKQRLLFGAMRLDPDTIRHQGAGQLLGRVLETDAVESLALSGGFQGLLACIELSMAALVLAMGSGGWPHALLLLLWVGVTLLIGWRYFKKRRGWTLERMNITNDLVEMMVGHRTRLTQEPRERWHEAEDQSLERYSISSQKTDRKAVLLSAIVPRGWLVLGILGLAPALLRSNRPTTTLAVGLGGLLLAYAALRRLTFGIVQLTDAAIAWKQVASLFHADADSRFAGRPRLDLAQDPSARAVRTGEVLMEVRDLVFHYDGRLQFAINKCNLRISFGDKLLLEGPSGSGKSTLASLLVGLRQPCSGLLLLRGFDRQTLGDEGWRRLIVSAPQFHENHVMTETFAFNLLMGKRWPAWAVDLEECEAVCRDLGLGELIDRMPAGLMQMVGETGWQLSHGERSRLYIARAILQHADLVVLDESFAALDPENLQRALIGVLKRAKTLLVIAHP
jgi:ATP-binding cassette subfamily B protein